MLSKIIWHLRSNKSKLKQLKKRRLTIGDGCGILNGYDFGFEPYLVEIGNNVRITSDVRITTHDGGMWVLRRFYPDDCANGNKFGRIKIGDNCHIGMNALIMPGVTIGENSIMGAGAIVTHDAPHSVAVGIPARVIETIDEYYQKQRERCPHQIIELARQASTNSGRRHLALTSIAMRQCFPSLWAIR